MAVAGQRDKPIKSAEKQGVGKNDVKKHGLQTEFNVGEQVLCYEPDPTKAKMLYEAKVLEIDVTKDEKGKKVPEFFIHFIGWNKSWDRWVLSDSVLKDCETSRNLQTKLYEKALGTKKRTRRKRMQDDENESMETNSQSNQSTANSSQAEGEESAELPVVAINIPHILKTKLEDDCYLIKRKKKLLRLPRVPCALKILTDFLEFCEMNEANENCSEVSYLRNSNIEIVREVVQGLQTYLNFTLSNLLLYNFEKEQYARIFDIKQISAKANEVPMRLTTDGTGGQSLSHNLPIVSPNRNTTPDKRESRRRHHLPLKGHQEKPSGVCSESLQQSASLTSPTGPYDKVVSSPSVPKRRGRPSRKRQLREAAVKTQLNSSQQDMNAIERKDDGKANIGEQQNAHSNIKDNINVRGQMDEQENDQNGRGSPLRHKRDAASFTSQEKNDSEREVGDRPDLSKESGLLHPASCSDRTESTAKRHKRDMVDDNFAAEEDSEGTSRILRPRRALNVEPQYKFLDKNKILKEHFNLPVGASASSMTISEANANPIMASSNRPDVTEEQDSSYAPFPLSTMGSKSPAEIYGVEHLLRLFVRLPSLLSRTDLDARKRMLLVEYLEKFLRYLADRASSLFNSDHYSESVI